MQTAFRTTPKMRGGQGFGSSHRPRVSILLPNLNNRRYLPERFESILSQTLDDWELIVVDNFSDDGAWEFIQQQAAAEPRMTISQAPRSGMYANWNRCLQKARGEFVYIATSDDTMGPTCLEKMVSSLDRHPTCDLSHCCLTVIDSTGNPIDVGWKNWDKNRIFGKELNHEHIRTAPHDGLLHSVFGTMYTSITELLVRRRVFNDTAGYFKNGFDSAGDFEWGIRAGMVCNVVHVPEFLATWRRHPEQATNDLQAEQPAGWRRFQAMIESAMNDLRARGNPHALSVNTRDLMFPARLFEITAQISSLSSRASKLSYIALLGARRPREVSRYLGGRLTHRPFSRMEYARKLLRKYDCVRAVRRV